MQNIKIFPLDFNTTKEKIQALPVPGTCNVSILLTCDGTGISFIVFQHFNLMLLGLEMTNYSLILGRNHYFMNYISKTRLTLYKE